MSFSDITGIALSKVWSLIVQVLLESIHDEPHIAEKVCYAISQLAAGLREAGAAELLSQFFKEIVQALLEAVRAPLIATVLCATLAMHCR